MRRSSGWLITTVLIGSLAFVGRADAQPKGAARTIQDDAGMFSPQAKSRANEIIARIHNTHNKDFLIETMAKAPSQPANVPNTKEGFDRFFDKWAVDRFKNEQANGVYVIIINDPKAHVVRVVVGDKTRDMGLFNERNREKLDDIWLASLKAKRPDEGLIEASNYVLTTMDQNQRQAGPAAPGSPGAPPTQQRPAPVPGTPAPQAQGGGIPWMTLIIIAAVAFVIFRVISAMARPRLPSAPAGGYGGQPAMGGGGGLFSNVLGGMLGAAGGMWVYNNLFGGGGNSAYGAGPTHQAPLPPDITDVGGGASVSGGDWGNDNPPPSGGDKGGGDWSGGGGGDWGGGGGDPGGGDVGGGGGGDWGGGGGGDW